MVEIENKENYTKTFDENFPKGSTFIYLDDFSK